MKPEQPAPQHWASETRAGRKRFDILKIVCTTGLLGSITFFLSNNLIQFLSKINDNYLQHACEDENIAGKIIELNGSVSMILKLN